MSAGVTRSRILVGVDGSSASDAAVRWAVREAAIRRLPITVIHAVAPTPIDSTMAPNGAIPQLRLARSGTPNPGSGTPNHRPVTTNRRRAD
jgi:nucleotide-binding universal stress UspA family protein